MLVARLAVAHRDLRIAQALPAQVGDLQHLVGEPGAAPVEAIGGLEHRASLVGLEDRPAWTMVSQATHPPCWVVA